jgi:hypothetical protein
MAREVQRRSGGIEAGCEFRLAQQRRCFSQTKEAWSQLPSWAQRTPRRIGESIRFEIWLELLATWEA